MRREQTFHVDGPEIKIEIGLESIKAKFTKHKARIGANPDRSLRFTPIVDDL